jgi:predicted ABC-type ATPase
VTAPFDSRPIVVAIAGPNGAGKTTFYEAHLAPARLRFVNADDLARELDVDVYEAAELAGRLRETLLEQGESFVFETVFSDPVGDKVAFLKRAEAQGYTVILCFIGVDGPEVSEERVAMRVLQGGHDVPTKKLKERYPRTLKNLAKAIRDLPRVLVFDNSDLGRPFRKVATFERGTVVEQHAPLPRWLPRGR